MLQLAESIPQSFIPRNMKGITLVFNSFVLALPHTAIIPFELVCTIALAKILPPTVSTTPSHKPLSISFGSLSNSPRFITLLAPNDFK